MNFTHNLFIDFIQSVLDQAISLEAALDWLVQAEDSLQRDTDALVQSIQESGYYEFSTDEVEHGITALSDYHEAVTAMHQFLADNWDEGLDVALDKAEEAREKMAVAYELSIEVQSELSFDICC